MGTLAGEVMCNLLDLSLGGARVEADHAVRTLGLVAGSKVRLTFHVLDDSEVIETDALVRWSDARGYGLQFGSLRARETWALGVYLAQVRGR